jgi:hypothetical protein
MLWLAIADTMVSIMKNSITVVKMVVEVSKEVAIRLLLTVKISSAWG